MGKRGRSKGRPTVQVRMDKEVLEAMRLEVAKRGLTMTEFANQAVAGALGVPWPPVKPSSES